VAGEYASVRRRERRMCMHACVRRACAVSGGGVQCTPLGAGAWKWRGGRYLSLVTSVGACDVSATNTESAVSACALPRRRAHESSRIEWCKIRHNAAAGAAANSRRAAASEFARGTGRCVCECNMHELVCVACSDVDGHLRQTTPYPVRSAKLSCLKLG
jgi:hypothetical protein